MSVGHGHLAIAILHSRFWHHRSYPRSNGPARQSSTVRYDHPLCQRQNKQPGNTVNTEQDKGGSGIEGPGMVFCTR